MIALFVVSLLVVCAVEIVWPAIKQGLANVFRRRVRMSDDRSIYVLRRQWEYRNARR